MLTLFFVLSKDAAPTFRSIDHYFFILDSSTVETLWECFLEAPFLFQHACAQVYKGKPIKACLHKFDVEELDLTAIRKPLG